MRNILRYVPKKPNDDVNLSKPESKTIIDQPRIYDPMDPIALLARGFQGSRGKRFEKIPILAGGFQAHRGK